MRGWVTFVCIMCLSSVSTYCMYAYTREPQCLKYFKFGFSQKICKFSQIYIRSCYSTYTYIHTYIHTAMHTLKGDTYFPSAVTSPVLHTKNLISCMYICSCARTYVRTYVHNGEINKEKKCSDTYNQRRL